MILPVKCHVLGKFGKFPWVKYSNEEVSVLKIVG